MKKNGTLTKLETLEDAHIPNEVGDGVRVGYFMEHPVVNSSFELRYTHKLGGIRTSRVKEILDDNGDFVIFKTNNSRYKLEIEVD